MQPGEFSSLPISCYRLGLRAREAGDLPLFLGSTLRGAFGHALKEAVCVMEHRDCARCMLAERCLYPYLFETPAPPDLPLLRGQQQAPRPFVLTPPVLETPEVKIDEPPPRQEGAQGLSITRAANAFEGSRASAARPTVERRRLTAGGELSFGLLLIGRATEYLPYVVYALSNLARRGLGAGRARFELVEVAALDERGEARVIYTERSPRIAPHGFATRSLGEFVRARLEGLPDGGALGLRFLTPTRVRVDGDLQAGLSFPLLVRNLLRRVSLLMAVHGRELLDVDYRALISRAERVETRSAALRWWDWERYSSRQETKMKLGGFVGEVEYAGGGLEEFLPLVAAGEILHVGTGTSFGLGRYRIMP
jgi:hypothetical protein